MTELNIHRRFSVMIRLTIIAVFLTGTALVAGDLYHPSLHDYRDNPDDLCTIQSVRRFLSEKIMYPGDAVESGQAGTVELYARVNSQGRIGEVLEIQPSRNYVDVPEIVVSANAAVNVQVNELSRHDILIAEGRRVITALPGLDMPEVYDQVLKFTFRFVLQ
jgi:bla regulator protein blaR1